MTYFNPLAGEFQRPLADTTLDAILEQTEENSREPTRLERQRVIVHEMRRIEREALERKIQHTGAIVMATGCLFVGSLPVFMFVLVLLAAAIGGCQ